jgi:hypothetical protein
MNNPKEKNYNYYQFDVQNRDTWEIKHRQQAYPNASPEESLKLCVNSNGFYNA